MICMPDRMTRARALYLAVYESQGGIWEANDCKELWCDKADRYLELLCGAMVDCCYPETETEEQYENCPCGGNDCSAVPGGPLSGCPYVKDSTFAHAQSMLNRESVLSAIIHAQDCGLGDTGPDGKWQRIACNDKSLEGDRNFHHADCECSRAADAIMALALPSPAQPPATHDALDRTRVERDSWKAQFESASAAASEYSEFWERHNGDFDQSGNYIPHSQMDGDLRAAKAEIEQLRSVAQSLRAEGSTLKSTEGK